MTKNSDKFDDAEAERRFKTALKGASNVKAKPPAPKRKRPTDYKGGKSGGK